MDDVVRSYLRDLIDLRMVSVLLRPAFVPLLRFLPKFIRQGGSYLLLADVRRRIRRRRNLI
jgi:hypothetical protein